ncbi:MAG: hypothetical protein QNK23_11435 [Crocinitomicaceae bacterium]|nr:hypothetical protein [Crocinitomicaceae bacterium]
MRLKSIISCFIVGSGIFFSCTPQDTSEALEEPTKIIEVDPDLIKDIDPTKLILTGTAEISLGVGYGIVYHIVPTEILYGELNCDRISLVFLAGSPKENVFYKDSLRIDANDQFTFEFEMEEKDVPYSLMPLNGFVDNDMTAWKVVLITPL